MSPEAFHPLVKDRNVRGPADARQDGRADGLKQPRVAPQSTPEPDGATVPRPPGKTAPTSLKQQIKQVNKFDCKDQTCFFFHSRSR